ncbi:MAG TPA: thiolase family protein [Candidatus Dormibacteraeota bacterium]|jgi:acetyl-CoA acyltransferase|nr:thiolase family protein [Candidatus Dormibacteraeota bacterium]
MAEALIVDVVRSPVGRGKAGGALAGTHPVDLLAQVLQALVARTGIDPGAVDDVIAGCVGQAGVQANNIARNAVLAAGFPEKIPGTTIDRQCGSSQQAVHFAAQGVLAGAYDVAIACGVESMSAVPMGSRTMGQDPYGSMLAARYPEGLVHQGISAELIAARWHISRADMDDLAAASHARAASAADGGAFDNEIVPVTAGSNGTTTTVTADEGIRRDTTAERLGGLRPAFLDDRWSERFPQIEWSVTAGNSSQISDGASAMLVCSPAAAARLGLQPRARLHSVAVIGDDPVMMLTGVIPATRMVLQRGGLAMNDIDVFEVNEAFAAVVLAWQQELDADLARVNVHGGAIALGHPLGASGVRLAATLLNALEQRDGRYGLQTMCEGGGMANAMVIERLPAAR